MIDAQLIQQIRQLKHNLPLFAKTYLRIVTTEGNLAPLIFNESQLRLHTFIEEQKLETGMVRVVVPKGRKQGVSTYASARFFHQAIFNPTKEVFILSHHSSTTGVLFSIVNNYYSHLPDLFKPQLIKNNNKQLQFANGSQYTVATAGEGEIGRGATPHYLHCSEMASYTHTDQLQTGIMKAVANAPGTEIIIESTGKGVGNMFHGYAMNGLEERGRYKTFFLPWYIHESNIAPSEKDFAPEPEELDLMRTYNLTIPQLQFRRNEIQEFSMGGVSGDWKFKQEFPATISEAFQTSGDSFFSPVSIANARKAMLTDIDKPLILGVDPARSGDRTVIAHRRGRHLIKLEIYNEMDEMRLAGILAQHCQKDKSLGAIFIDTAHGYGTIDRLRELGFGRLVTGVNFAEKPVRTEVFRNKRAEMYHSCKEWMADGDVRLPDSDDMELDLLAIPSAIEDSSGRILLVPKDEIKKKYGKSPDIADAIILTFAYPIRNPNIDLSAHRAYTKESNSSANMGGLSSPVIDGFNRGARRHTGFRRI